MGSRWKWIPTERPFLLPENVKEIIKRLKKSGFEALVVGGSVRDFILGRRSKDHDIATNATPDQILKIFSSGSAVGKHFGVIMVGDVEICTFRRDLEYVDHRHPKGVIFGTIEEDALRRDFTVNGLYYDSTRKQILDGVGGFEDLQKGVIRAIGKPKSRFDEDALRLIRAVRFSSSLDFNIDSDTLDAIVSRAKLIKKVSAERVRDELNRIWLSPNLPLALETLSASGLLEQLIPELHGLKRSSAPRKILIKILDGFSDGKGSLEMVWASCLQALPKAVGYPKLLARFKLSAAMSAKILYLADEQPRIREVFGMRESTLARLVRSDHFAELLEFHQRVALASDGNLAYYDFALARFQEYQSALAKGEDPSGFKFVTGDDLIELGLEPSPRFTEILRAVEDLVLEKRIKDKQEALEYVLQNFVR